MTLTSEEKEYWHNKGQEDVAEERIFTTGPWPGIFEPDEDFKERESQYQKGEDNAYKNK